MFYKKSYIVSILGRQWELFFCRRLKRLPDGQQARGWCDKPDAKGKSIRIRAGQSEEDELDTILHELLHAAGWHLDEPFVEQFATDAASILIRLGWRRTKDTNQKAA